MCTIGKMYRFSYLWDDFEKAFKKSEHATLETLSHFIPCLFFSKTVSIKKWKIDSGLSNVGKVVHVCQCCVETDISHWRKL
jgi:hypothetical protein